MTLSTVFDISPQNPLQVNSLGNMVGGAYINNPYATLNNTTSLSPLSQDTYLGQKYYCGDAPGTHKNLNWKHIFTGAVVLAGALASLKYGASKLGSLFKNSQIRKLEKAIKNSECEIENLEKRVNVQKVAAGLKNKLETLQSRMEKLREKHNL